MSSRSFNCCSKMDGELRDPSAPLQEGRYLIWGLSSVPKEYLLILLKSSQWQAGLFLLMLKSRGVFLGLAGYYRKFVHHFGVISKPLTELLKKNVLFIWTFDHDKAFNTLKYALVLAPVLALPDFSKTFYIETDALDCGVGAVLMQDYHPLAFVSKALGSRMRELSTYEKEYVFVLLAVEHWKQ
jgi:hypothetical protein